MIENNYLLCCLVVSSFFSGLLFAQIPENYYDDAENKKGNELKQALYEIIGNHRVFPYTSSSTDVWDILQKSDEDPNDSERIILVYTGRSQEKGYRDGSGNYSNYENGNGSRVNSWNREHIWPKSHGFPDSDDEAYTDAHHLKPCDNSVNSSRGNKDFDYGGSQHSEATACRTDGDSWEPRDQVKGDIARMLFYMVVRYDPGYHRNNSTYDLELVDYTGTSSSPILGKLSSLLQWHIDDPVDDFEQNRNEVIFSYQENRNPFIDHPSLVEYIWGNEQQNNWSSSLSISEVTPDSWEIYPNPVSSDRSKIHSTRPFDSLEIFTLKGQIIDQSLQSGSSFQSPSKKGMYFVRLMHNQNTTIQKLIVN